MILLIYGIQKNGTNELIYKDRKRATDIEDKFMVTRGKGAKRDKLRDGN